MRSLNRGHKRVRPLLGAFVEIELRGRAGASVLDACIARGFEAIAQVDRLMSFHRADSDLSRLNGAQSGTWVRAHPLTIELLDASNELFAASRGVFDIRCTAVPSDRSLLRRPPVDIRGLRTRKTGPWTLDLGGIAKGFAVDLAAERMRRMSAASSGVVNAGGDLRLWGPDRAGAAVRVHSPGFPRLRPLALPQTAAATSSIRARRGVDHVRMPGGIPSRAPMTATVFADRCWIADALTKVALLAPPDIAARCLARYQARALVFGPDGLLSRALGPA